MVVKSVPCHLMRTRPVLANLVTHILYVPQYTILILVIIKPFLYVCVYSGCSDDDGKHYSIGEQFTTSNYGQCFCGNGGNVTCNQLYSKSTDNTNSKLNVYWTTHYNQSINFASPFQYSKIWSKDNYYGYSVKCHSVY